MDAHSHDEHTHTHEHGGEMDLEAAHQLVEQHKAQQLQAFQAELDQLCQKYGVVLGTTPVQITVRLLD